MRKSTAIPANYSITSRKEIAGIKIDIVIKTKRSMTMSELLKNYAALSHTAYLEIANNVAKYTH